MEREGLEVELIPPPLKVLDVLKLMDNDQKVYKNLPHGIFQLVNDATDKGKFSNDEMSKRTENLYKDIATKHEKSVVIQTKKGKATKFTICHSAKNVIYDATNFIDRNADSMSATLNKFLIDNCDPIVSMIYQIKTGKEKAVEEEVDAKGQRKPP